MTYKFDLLPTKGPFQLDSRQVVYSFVTIFAFLIICTFLLAKFDLNPNYLVPFIFVVTLGQYAWSNISRRRYHNRVAAFAAANKLASPDSENVEVDPPVLNRSGAHNEVVRNQYDFKLNDETCTVYDYSFDISSGRNRRTYYYSVAHVRLPKQFPHIFLDGRGNRLGSLYAHKQELALEGDFNRYFTLYLPDNEQVDVLSILSPDVMQTLVDSGRPYDIEITGKDVYICSGRPFYTQNALPHVLAFTQKLADELQQRSVSWRQALPGKPAPQLQIAFWKTAKGRAILILVPIALYVILNVYISSKHY